VAGKGKRRQRVELERSDLEHLRTCAHHASFGEPRLVGDANHAGSAPFGDVEDADQPGELDLRADLFKAFPRRRFPWVLVIVDKAARQAPQPSARLDRPAAEHDAAVDLDHHRGRDLRVVEPDPPLIN